ncbi:MAG: GFA family protein [Pseudomonadota bacterium]
MSPITGHCKCGETAYKVNGPTLQVVSCHCGLCRSLTGAAFSTYVVVKESQLTVTSDPGSLTAYQVTDRTRRYFCRTCGTPLFNANPETYKGLRMLYLGTVRGHEQLEPAMNIFCESKLPWTMRHEPGQNFQRAPGEGR